MATLIETFHTKDARDVRLKQLREHGRKHVSKHTTSHLVEEVNQETGEITTKGVMVWCLSVGSAL